MKTFHVFKSKASKFFTTLYFMLTSVFMFHTIPAVAAPQTSGGSSGGSSSGGGFGSMFQSSNIQLGTVSADKLVNNIVGVICGIAGIIGIFMIVTGIIKYLQAQSEHNGSDENKAIQQAIIGVAFTGMGIIVNAVFG